MKQNFYQPYFECIKQILDGNHVQDLDGVREQCNLKYYKTHASGVSHDEVGHTPESIVISFAANAENNILSGTDPHEAYDGFQGLESANFRRTGRKILERAVRDV